MAREDDSYLTAAVDAELGEIRSRHPDATVVSGPSNRRIGGHLSAVFLVRYGNDAVAEEIAVVVSQAHERMWVLRFELDSGLYEAMNPVFERMLSGFTITLLTPEETFATAIGFLGVCGIGALIPAIVLTVWSDRRAARRGSPKSVGGSERLPGRCPKCGAPVSQDYRFCWRCGAEFQVAGEPRRT